MSFPTIVYKNPGAHPGPDGTSYDYKGVGDAKALAVALGEGWRVSLAVVSDVPADDAPPTRAELEEQATALGLKFDGRTPDARLSRLISDNLQGGS